MVQGCDTVKTLPRRKAGAHPSSAQQADKWIPAFAGKAIRWRFHRELAPGSNRGRVGRPAGGQLAIFGLMAAIVAALWVRETLVALAPRAIEAAAGD
jgi:hypothetical protein